MTAVTEAQIVKRRHAQNEDSFPVLASTAIYQGTLVYVVAASGYATGDDAGGANAFVGVALETADNSSGSNGDINVRVIPVGQFLLTGSGFSQATVGDLVYGIDNFTLQTSATSATLIGRVKEYVSSTQVWVELITSIDQ